MTSEKERYLQGRAVLGEAIERLAQATDGYFFSELPKLTLTLALLTSVMEYSASGNSIPGFRGLGYAEAIRLAEAINCAEKLTGQTIQIHSYKPLLQSLEVNS